MRRLILALSLIVPVFAAGRTVRAAEGGAEKAVIAALDTWKEATLKKDRALFEKVYHPDLTYVHSSGMIENKQQAIEHVAGNPKSVYESVTISDTKVKVTGSLAVVTAKVVIVQKGHDTNDLLGMFVWTKTPKGWQLIAREATKIVPPGAHAAAKPAGAAATPTSQTPAAVPAAK